MTAIYENAPAAVRYIEPKACTAARRKLLDPFRQAALAEMIDRYKKAGDEKPVAITSRQIAQSCKMSRATAARAILDLVDKGFVVVVSKGQYDDKRKPSRYRLTMFPCNGDDATHDYIEDPKAWRRQRRVRKLGDDPKEPTVTVKLPVSRLMEAIGADFP
jgi:hypothetical protein